MKCVICKQGDTELSTTTVALTRGNLTLVVRNVPAQVCPNCGEAYVDEPAATQLLETVEQLVQAGTQVDVREYKAA